MKTVEVERSFASLKNGLSDGQSVILAVKPGSCQTSATGRTAAASGLARNPGLPLATRVFDLIIPEARGWL
jgi:hypothetical protein